MSGLPACMDTVCVPSLYEVQRRASNSLELELEMTVNQHVDGDTAHTCVNAHVGKDMGLLSQVSFGAIHLETGSLLDPEFVN